MNTNSPVLRLSSAVLGCLVLALVGCTHAPLRQMTAEFDGLRTLDSAPDITAPVAVRTVAPEHPDALLRAGVEGEALVQCWIDASGAVRDVTDVRASRADFADAAVAAIGKWRFAPGTRNGSPVAVRVEVPFEFKLGSSGTQRF